MVELLTARLPLQSAQLTSKQGQLVEQWAQQSPLVRVIAAGVLLTQTIKRMMNAQEGKHDANRGDPEVLGADTGQSR